MDQFEPTVHHHQQAADKRFKLHSSFLLLGLVDVGAAFPQVEVDLVSGVTTLQL